MSKIDHIITLIDEFEKAIEAHTNEFEGTMRLLDQRERERRVAKDRLVNAIVSLKAVR